MGAHYQDQNAVQLATDACLATGMRVLQLYRCGDEVSHVRRLLEAMSPPEGACIVDVGCGVGEVARLMADDRPDLGFILLNLSAYQLELCPVAMERVHADMHDMPIVDGCADVVMVNYTLGYADLDKFMREAARVLKPGGILFVYDLTRNHAAHGPDELMLEKFSYKVYARHVLAQSAALASLAFDDMRVLPATPYHLDPLLDEEYRGVMGRLSTSLLPTAMRFVKEGL